MNLFRFNIFGVLISYLLGHCILVSSTPVPSSQAAVSARSEVLDPSCDVIGLNTTAIEMGLEGAIIWPVPKTKLSLQIGRGTIQPQYRQITIFIALNEAIKAYSAHKADEPFDPQESADFAGDVRFRIETQTQDFTYGLAIAAIDALKDWMNVTASYYYRYVAVIDKTKRPCDQVQAYLVIEKDVLSATMTGPAGEQPSITIL